MTTDLSSFALTAPDFSMNRPSSRLEFPRVDRLPPIFVPPSPISSSIFLHPTSSGTHTAVIRMFIFRSDRFAGGLRAAVFLAAQMSEFLKPGDRLLPLFNSTSLPSQPQPPPPPFALFYSSRPHGHYQSLSFQARPRPGRQPRQGQDAQPLPMRGRWSSRPQKARTD